MTIDRPMFPPVEKARPVAPFLRIVGGLDAPLEASTPTAGPAPHKQPRKRKERGPDRERVQIEYQDGLPVIDPAGEEDRIFRCIADHRAAIVHYDRCVDVEQAAEGKVSTDEYSYLQHNTSNACDQMMFFARNVISCRPTTRRGLIHQARYLVSQFNDLEGCEGGCMYLPDNIGERPWPMAFLQSLAAGLRKMGGELAAPKEGGQK